MFIAGITTSGRMKCHPTIWHGSYKKLKPLFKDFSRSKFVFQGPFVECHFTCLTKWIILYEPNLQPSVVKTALSRHFVAKWTPTFQLCNAKPAPCGMSKSISTHIHNRWSVWCRLTFWLVFGFAFFTQFFALFLCFFFTKLKRKNTLISTMQLWRDASDSMLGKFNGFSRPYSGIKDFSRIFGNPGLFKDLYKDF